MPIHNDIKLVKRLNENYSFQVDYEKVEDPAIDELLMDYEVNPEAILRQIKKTYYGQDWLVMDEDTGEILADADGDGQWQVDTNPRPLNKGQVRSRERNIRDIKYSKMSDEEIIQDLASTAKQKGLVGDSVQDFVIDNFPGFVHPGRVQDVLGIESKPRTLNPQIMFRLVQKVVNEIAEGFPDLDPGDVAWSVLHRYNIELDNPEFTAALEKLTGESDVYAYWDSLLDATQSAGLFKDYSHLTEERNGKKMNEAIYHWNKAGSKRDQKKYYRAMAEEMGGKLVAIRFGDWSREITVSLPSIKFLPAGNYTISHNWDYDGTETKPVTEIWTSENNCIELGRWSIWPGEPDSYAEDIMTAIKEFIDKFYYYLK
jgi:hypothetical protein